MPQPRTCGGKYAGSGLDLSSIEEVDFVSDGRPIHEVISHRAHYDFIFASNVIEHMPDFIAFFNGCDPLLKDDGVLVLAVPDKRSCFDAMQSITMTGEILQAHLDRRHRHYPGRAFDTVANLVEVNHQGAWLPRAFMKASLTHSLEAAKAEFDRLAAPDAGYIDHHTWRFTPSSLRLIVQDLNELGLVRLREVEQVCYEGFEFFVSYSRSGPSGCRDRLALLHMIAQEQVEGYKKLLDAFNYEIPVAAE